MSPESQDSGIEFLIVPIQFLPFNSRQQGTDEATIHPDQPSRLVASSTTFVVYLSF